MSDIVERLRVPVMLHSNPEQTNAERREAADEIARLRRELDVEKALVAFHQKNEQVKNAEIERLTDAIHTCRELREHDRGKITRIGRWMRTQPVSRRRRDERP